MAGTASSQLRSASVLESTPGTTPATPGFGTHPAPILMMATAQNTHQSSLAAGGANVGLAKLTLPVTGKMSAQLVYGVYDDWFRVLLQSAAWATNVIFDAKSRQTETVENSLPAGINGTTTYLRYQGVEAVGGQIVAEANKPIMFSLDFVGMGSSDPTTTVITGATYTDAGNIDPMASNFDVGTVTFAGQTFDNMFSATIDFVYEGRDPQPKIGSDITNGTARGAFKPTIKARFYVDTNFAAALLLARADHAAFKITINLGSVTLNKYKFEFWTCYADIADPDFSTNGSAFVDMTFTPAYSAANSAVVTLTRAIA